MQYFWFAKKLQSQLFSFVYFKAEESVFETRTKYQSVLDDKVDIYQRLPMKRSARESGGNNLLNHFVIIN